MPYLYDTGTLLTEAPRTRQYLAGSVEDLGASATDNYDGASSDEELNFPALAASRKEIAVHCTIRDLRDVVNDAVLEFPTTPPFLFLPQSRHPHFDDNTSLPSSSFHEPWTSDD